MRKLADCRTMPSESGCSLTIAGEPEELLRAAVEHAVSTHGHEDTPELREGIAAMLTDESPGAALLAQGYDAFARQDIPAVLALFADDIVWETPASIPIGGTYRGPAGVAEFFGRLPELFSEVAVVPERYVEQGDTVVVMGRDRGRSQGGTAYDVPFVHVWTVREGKAVRFAEHLDTAELNAALGMPAQRTRDSAADARSTVSG